MSNNCVFIFIFHNSIPLMFKNVDQISLVKIVNTNVIVTMVNVTKKMEHALMKSALKGGYPQPAASWLWLK